MQSSPPKAVNPRPYFQTINPALHPDAAVTITTYPPGLVTTAPGETVDLAVHLKGVTATGTSLVSVTRGLGGGQEVTLSLSGWLPSLLCPLSVLKPA
jgi:hypothetical protein